MFFFFFQAEDGIRDYKVTGVQTCALPIWGARRRGERRRRARELRSGARSQARAPGARARDQHQDDVLRVAGGDPRAARSRGRGDRELRLRGGLEAAESDGGVQRRQVRRGRAHPRVGERAPRRPHPSERRRTRHDEDGRQSRADAGRQGPVGGARRARGRGAVPGERRRAGRERRNPAGDRRRRLGVSEPVVMRDVVVVGGGCYGTFYAGQLAKAKERGKARFRRVVVVDRDPACRARLELGETPDRVFVAREWDDYFAELLGGAAPAAAGEAQDYIVPSPLMPHLMFQWLVARARERWPRRPIDVAPLPGGPGAPDDPPGAHPTRDFSLAD